MSHDDHLDRDETFEMAHAMYANLEYTCPGCTMGIISVLISMLAVHYTREEAKEGRIFDHNDWMNYIIDAARAAADKFDRRNIKKTN